MPVDQIAASHPAALSLALLSWYGANARALPWRAAPGSNVRPDPYCVLVAEMMAQQTRAEVAARRWPDFIARWPTAAALAAAPEEEVLRQWAGLGYYRRAHQLHAAAKAVARDGAGHKGGFPTSEAELRRLPGIGPYTAAAIAAFAFGAQTIAFDTNVQRVGARLFAIEARSKAEKERIAGLLRQAMPPGAAADFNQALMDLGAGICTATAPSCARCPLRSFCEARRLGAVDRYPAPAAKPVKQDRRGLSWWIESAGLVATVKRPANGLLPGMTALPGTPWSAEEELRLPFAARWIMLAEPVRHIFTHIRLALFVAATRIDARPDMIDGQRIYWVERGKLREPGLPTLYRKVVRMMDGLAEGGTSSSSGRLRLITRPTSSAGKGRPK